MQIFVTPNKGARVRMPDRNSTVMGEQGAWILRSVYYETLIAAGDVIVADPQPARPAGQAAVPAAEPAGGVVAEADPKPAHHAAAAPTPVVKPVAPRHSSKET